MSHDIINSTTPEDIRVNVVMPKQNNIKVLAMSNPVFDGDNIDKDYEKRISPHIKRINQQEQILARDKGSLVYEFQKVMDAKKVVQHDGQRVYRLFHNLNNRRGQEAIDLFQEFNQSGNHYVFDIETFGDSQERKNPYGISEISLNKYNTSGELIEEGYNGFLRQNDDIVNHLQEIVEDLKQDKYKYNSLSEYDKRSIVDLMRYSTYKETTDTHAFSTKGGIQHHSIIDSVFNYKDQVDHGKVVREMKMYLPYIESGLETVKNTGDSPKDAMKKVSTIMRKNPDTFFLSYNGNQFDMPVMQAFADKMGVSLPKNIKHLDYLNVIKTAYMDSDDLKRQVDPNYKKSPYGKDKLAAFRSILPEDESSQKDAHNAAVDTNDTAKVIAATRNHIQNELNNSKVPIREGFNFHPTEMTWNDQEHLKTGQTLFANGGIQAFREGDESFSMSLNEDGKWVAQSNGFNKTVINSKTFYQFAGHVAGEDAKKELGDETKQAFRFYDPDRQEYAYVVRSGEHAFNELRDFVQSRFYNWENLDSQTKREISHAAETDRARRRYSRYFGIDGVGKGLTVIDGNVTEKGTMGFSGLKRMLRNAEIMETHLQSNKNTKQKVEKLINQGLSRNQAKKQVRNIRTHELLEKLDFNSQWDPEKKAYVLNKSEQKQFFKMYKRLIAERPKLEEAVNQIDAEYRDQIDAASKITNHIDRQNNLRFINQKRDQALMRYYQQVKNEVGTPTQDVSLKHFENHRISYLDPESNIDYDESGKAINNRSINFETVGTAQSHLYGYAKRGVEDSPNKQRVMRERLSNLLGNLNSQDKISSDQYEHYMKTLHHSDSVWSAAGEIAIDMRNKNGGKYETTRTEPSLTGNANIQNLSESSNQQFIKNAIQDTNNAEFFIKLDAVKGKKLELGEEVRRTLDWLDKDRFSRLNSNNYQAIEELVTSIQKHADGRHITLTMDENNKANLKAYVYDPKNSIQVNNQLQRGQIPSHALEINMPLINEVGTHKVGNMVLNAHSIAVLEGKDVNMISSAQKIARGYANNMYNIMNAVKDGDYDTANTLSRRTLRREIESMSGIQRNMEIGENDTYRWSSNQSDELKQSHVKLANAMIEDLYYNGYDGIKLTESDFYDWNDVAYQDKTSGKMKLRRGVTFEDVTGDTSYKMLMKMPKWAEDRLGQTLFTSSIKAEHVAKGTLSLEDVRELMPYGTFFNHERDNAVQYMNAFLLNDNVKNGIDQTSGVSRGSLLVTPRQVEYEKYRNEKGLQDHDVSINMKTAFMTQDQLRHKINHMYSSEEGNKLLGELGFLDDQGNLIHEKLPRLYEQQGIIAKDVSDMLEVDNEKRYAKGKQFEVNKNLELGQTIQPGTLLGHRIHDNGTKEEVKYNGNKPAKILSGLAGSEDILVQWQSSPFKIMLDGEKMTDSPVDRRFIQSLTGKDDIVAIINPDVTKHKDFGMLMSGEARLMADEINNLNGRKKKKAIQIIEDGGIGLKWDYDRERFVDHSFDININRGAFDNVFKKLNEKGIHINPVTSEGIRYGILDAHLSKVSNYSRVVDHTGRAVLGFDSNGKKIYGEEGGVQWGHREMGVLKSNGMDKTYQHVYDVMKSKSKRLDEAMNVKESLKYLANDVGTDIVGIDASEFESLPEMHRNLIAFENGKDVAGSYKGTIFDQQAVNNIVQRMEEKHGPLSDTVNKHGFWLNLPSVERTDGQLDKVTINMGNGKQQEINKIFVPFTAMEGANGDIHLRDLQRHIASIYDKAAAVNSAKDIGQAREAHSELQSAVKGYIKQSFHELTSSKGMVLGEAFKTHMSTSASGLFKLMDFDTSQKLMDRYGEGQYTIISENMAKKMGVFDKLNSGEELFTANVRYPTFHDGAMQFTKLRMADWVKDGEIHTTSFSSMLQNADSDGDYSHLVVIDNKEVQDEWKKAHDNNEKKFQDRWEAHRAKEDPSVNQSSKLPVSLQRTSPKEDIIKQIGNSDSQMAAKIGKMTIGRASNLNLFIRQVADRFYSNDADMNYKMKEFGRGLEQKLIDAKHGAKPAGLDMIDSIYSGNWNRAFEIDEEYFDKKFQEDFNMRDVAREMPEALTQMKNGLRTEGFKFGTSTGLSSQYGVKNLVDLIHGQADPSEYGGDNKGLAMMQKYLREQYDENIPAYGTPEYTNPLERLTATPMQEKLDNTKGILNKARNLASDAIGGTVSDVGEKVKKLWSDLKGMDTKKKLLLGGGLAVAGLAGYNILSSKKPEMHYIKEPELKPGQEQISSRREPVPALDVSMGMPLTNNASISISASGNKLDHNQMPQMVTQGMRDVGMNAGPTRISVTTRDNTQQLSRQWYRDKVRENM